YALIGPNGAGKTTLINLLTGMLRPDSGAIFLAGQEITALKPEARVRQGLARTFQINTLFPRLTPLESVAIAVLERSRDAHNWWRALPAFGDSIEAASRILVMVGGRILVEGTPDEIGRDARVREVYLGGAHARAA